jgi:hypothetical protein
MPLIKYELEHFMLPSKSVALVLRAAVSVHQYTSDDREGSRYFVNRDI